METTPDTLPAAGYTTLSTRDQKDLRDIDTLVGRTLAKALFRGMHNEPFSNALNGRPIRAGTRFIIESLLPKALETAARWVAEGRVRRPVVRQPPPSEN